jgi:hypothetical protein
MSNIGSNDSKMASIILAAYKSKVIDALYNDMLEEIKPKLHAAARQAANELEPSMRTYLDHMHNQMHIELVLKGLEGESK